MKAFKIAPLALAIGALSFSTVSSAEYWGDSEGDSATVNKEVNVAVDWDVSGHTSIGGHIRVDRMGMAIVDDTQSSTDNIGDNTGSSNSSKMGDSALRDASGNIGVNIAAGDNNVQGNSAALAASDAGFVFGKGKKRRHRSVGSAADAEVFSNQTAYWNNTYNEGHKNRASMGASALRGASGNIGVNIAAGNNNVQKNGLSGAVGFGALSIATVNVDQSVYGNYTDNGALTKIEKTTANVKLNAKNLGFYLDDVDYKGQAKQTKDIYPEVWNNDHPNGTFQIGHVDLDGDDKLEMREKGKVKFSELGKIDLKGSMTGKVTIYSNVLDERTVNTSSMGDYAMAAASGNIGVNVATGTNNLQNNSLAIAALRGPAVDGHDGGGHGGHGGHGGGHGGGYGGMLGGIIGSGGE